LKVVPSVMMTVISWYSGWVSGFIAGLTQYGPADGDRQARERGV
jgi:hypothetical protein